MIIVLQTVRIRSDTHSYHDVQQDAPLRPRHPHRRWSSNRTSLSHQITTLTYDLPTTTLLTRPPKQGAGIARVLADPQQGNLAVALLARRAEPLNDLVKSLKSQVPGSVIEAFPSDTSPQRLERAFGEIKSHKEFEGLRLTMVLSCLTHPPPKALAVLCCG